MSYDRKNTPYEAPKALGASGSSISEYGERVANALHYLPGNDLIPIVQLVGGRVNPLGLVDYEANLDGTILVHAPKDFDIQISTLNSRTRNRFTIAHELGHYFLHSRQGEIPIKAARSGFDLAEREANSFAAGFLMPVAKLQAAFAANPNVYYLAALFDVSASAMSIRLQNLRLIGYP